MAVTETQAPGTAQASRRPLKVGIIGIGVGSTEVMPAMEAMPEIDLVAGADIVPETLERFQKRYPETRVYDSAEKLCADPDVEAVWISTPNRWHAPHTILAAQHGKHVVVEKPMALSIEQGEGMIDACDKAGVKLLAGHTRSFGAPIRTIRKIVNSGKLGRLAAMNMWAYTDWMLRPRTWEELDLEQGGGIPYRQGPHQIDTVRFIGGGMVRSVRAMAGQWFAARSIPGYYAAYLEFEDGTPTTIVHNGYGYFLGAELVPWGESRQRYTVEERAEVRRQLVTGTRDEEADKQALRIGGSAEQRTRERPAEPRGWVPEDMGILIVSCERGDIRQSRFGLYIYDDEGQKDIPLRGGSGWESFGGGARRGELVELYDGVALGKPIFHDGRWGLATLEICLAIMQSGRERREIMLTHQKPVPKDYDADLDVDY